MGISTTAYWPTAMSEIQGIASPAAVHNSCFDSLFDGGGFCEAFRFFSLAAASNIPGKALSWPPGWAFEGIPLKIKENTVVI